ncbi:MAG: hypothetical protein LUD72_03500 [Bacteroidales bacterium]|nr:hypothetical protein [Bacteroidales bacterium]
MGVAPQINKTDLTGYYEDKDFFTTRGDSRISLQVARNEYTLDLGRDNRFLVGDPGSKHQLAYALTKPMKGNLTYNDKGTYSFVCQEVESTDFDNMELGIADYYKHFPKEPLDGIPPITDDGGDTEDKGENNGKKVWI